MVSFCRVHRDKHFKLEDFLRTAITRSGKKRQLPTGRILSASTPRQGRTERSIYEGIDLFPGSDGFLRESGRTSLIMGWDEDLGLGQKWDGETIRDFYLKFSHHGQGFFLVKKGLEKADFGSKAFWDGLKLFLTRDCIYVVERPKIGLYRFDPNRVIPVSTKNNDREYPVTGLRHCRLVTQKEAKHILSKFMRDF